MSAPPTSHSNDFLAALNQSRIPGLDAVRAWAVFLVLASHSGWGSVGGMSALDGGFGVLMFFVLSGFLITRGLLGEIERDGQIRLGRFYLRRAARLLPVFYVYLLIGMVLLLLANRPVPWGGVWSSSVYVINYYQAFTGAAPHYLSHCWSLAVEEQFYLIWPLLLLLVCRRLTAPVWGVVGLMLAFTACRWFWIAQGASDEYLYRALETRADQLALGGVLACVLHWPRVGAFIDRIRHPGWILLAIYATAVCSMTWLRDGTFEKYGLGYTLEPLLVAAGLPLVILLASRPGAPARLLNAGWLVWIGRVSYGIYLFHPMIQHPVRNTLERLGCPLDVAIAASIASVALVASISFRWFEEPLRQRLTQPSRGPA